MIKNRRKVTPKYSYFQYWIFNYLATNTTLNAKINEVKSEVPSITRFSGYM